MMFSTNRLVGAAVYRTRKALNASKAFMKAVESYDFAPNCLYDNTFHMWHFPGTHAEISRVMHQMSKTVETNKMKFPCIMNFLPVKEDIINPSRSGGLVQVRLNLAICAITSSGWLTQMRELKVFDPILRPVYSEFINQISRMPYIQHGHGIPQHSKVEIYTTGANAGQIFDRYDEHIDAIEIVNLQLTYNPALCDKYFQQMADESEQVLTEFI